MNTSRPARRLVTLSAAIALTSSLAACGGSDGTASSGPAGTGGSGGSGGGTVAGKTIGFSPYTLQAPALQGLAKGLEGIAKAQGMKVVSADAKADAVTQQQQLNGWVQRQQVQALWILPVNPQGLSAVLKSAQAKKIAVLAAGVPKDYGLSGPQPGIAFSNTDNAQFGTELATLASSCYTSRLGGKGTLIEVRDPRPSDANVAIETAISSTLAQNAPGVTVVKVDATDRLKAQQAVRTALQAHPEANGVIGSNDETALGGLGAFEGAGKKATAICAAGAGGGDEALAAVKSGRLYGEVAFDFQKDLGQNVAELTRLITAPSSTGKVLTIPLNVVKGTA